MPVLCHFTGAVQPKGDPGVAAASWAGCSNTQPRRLGLKQMHTKESQRPSMFLLYPHPPNLGYLNVIPNTGIPSIML